MLSCFTLRAPKAAGKSPVSPNSEGDYGPEQAARSARGRFINR